MKMKIQAPKCLLPHRVMSTIVTFFYQYVFISLISLFRMCICNLKSFHSSVCDQDNIISFNIYIETDTQVLEFSYTGRFGCVQCGMHLMF